MEPDDGPTSGRQKRRQRGNRSAGRRARKEGPNSLSASSSEEDAAEERKRSSRAQRRQGEENSGGTQEERGRRSRRQRRKQLSEERTTVSEHSETSQKDSSLPGSQRELQAIPMTQKHKAIMAGREDVERERKQGAEAYEYLKPENKDARTLQVFEEDAATGEFHMVQRNGNLFHSSQQNLQQGDNMVNGSPASPPSSYISSKLSFLLTLASGMAAGAGLANVLIQFQFDGDDEFIEAVGNFNGTMRILMFIFVCLGWIHACLLYSQSSIQFVANTGLPYSLASTVQSPAADVNNGSNVSNYRAVFWLRQYTILAYRYGSVALFFESLALVSTLVMYRTDNKLSAVAHENDPDLRDDVLDNMSLWRSMDVVRFVSLTLSWIMFLRMHLWVSSNFFEMIANLCTVEGHLTEQLNGTESPAKEEMSVEQLRKLKKKQEENLKQTQKLLEGKKSSKDTD